MQATIIRETNTVSIDGFAFEIGAVALLDKTIHAVQWRDGRGEIEYSYVICDHCGVGSKKPNAAFTDFTPYQALADAHAQAKAAAIAEAARVKAAEEAAQLAAESSAAEAGQ